MVRERTKKHEAACQELKAKNQELKELINKLAYLESVNNRMAKFVPMVVKKIIEENPDMDMGKQKKDVSILILDIMGCTTLCENLSHTDMNYIIERYFSAFLDHIHFNHADVNETMGDGLMAIYQGKGEVENAVNATLSALAILETTRRYNKELWEKFEPVEINIGISSGVAFVGVTKFSSITGKRWTYTASGPITNLSSRLCSAAENGCLLIDEETAQRVKGIIKARELGEMEFRNVSGTMRVFTVDGEPSSIEYPAL